MDLVAKVLELHRSLERALIPHAFGGALALAYCTLDPRGTSDIDCNVFVPSATPASALDALPAGVQRTDTTAATIERDGQVRLWWDGTPVDLFFDYAPIHEVAARRRRLVPFAGIDLPVLGCTDLVVFKALFDRTKDWADIEAAVAAGTLDTPVVRDELVALLGVDDRRVVRFDGAAVRTPPHPAS